MPLNRYQQLSYRIFGDFAEQHTSYQLKKNLQSAHTDIRPAAYMASSLFSTLLFFIISIVTLTILGLFVLPILEINIDFLSTVLFILLSLPITLLCYALLMLTPGSKARSRGKNIDKNLAYAVNFVSAMASAGSTPTEIFKSLSKQEIYGEIKEESSWIYRDVALLGNDIISAIKKNIEINPSQRFKEFLQGMIVTISSGGSLKKYFMSKADQYMRENHQRQKEMLETLGVMAESYVTAAVAGILLLLIVIPLMMIISGEFNGGFLYLIIFLVVPLIHLGFAATIKIISEAV